MKKFAGVVILSCAAFVVCCMTGCSPDGGKPIPQKKEVTLTPDVAPDKYTEGENKGKDKPSELLIKDKASLGYTVSFAKIQSLSITPADKGVTFEKDDKDGDHKVFAKIAKAAEVTAEAGAE